MSTDEDAVWVEVEVNKTPGMINTYRGRIDRASLDLWARGELRGSMQLSDVYWQEGEDPILLGEPGPFVNFTGVVYIRADAIVALLVLRDGRERHKDEVRDKVVRLAPRITGSQPRRDDE